MIKGNSVTPKGRVQSWLNHRGEGKVQRHEENELQNEFKTVAIAKKLGGLFSSSSACFWSNGKCSLSLLYP